MVELLFACDETLDYLSRRHLTPLLLAAKHQRPKSASLLLSLNADPTIVDGEGQSLLLESKDENLKQLVAEKLKQSVRVKMLFVLLFIKYFL